MIRVLEVSLAMLQQDAPQQIPGTIVFADAVHGVFVQCKEGQFLRLNIVEMAEGILSGFKMAELGIKAGEVFQTVISEAINL